MGLLQKARELRARRDPFAFDREFEREAGISREDQREILEKIDQVAKENRIRVDPDVFDFRPRKRGFLFPLTVNLLAAASLAGGIFLLYHFFRQEESVAIEQRHVIASAEGKLIRELKRQSEASLAEKEREIASIQARLAEIDRERTALSAGMEERIAAREAELRRMMEKELAAERERLLGQRISETEVRERMAGLEAEKERELQEKVTVFRRELEIERTRQEAALAALRTDFARDLERANLERSGLLEEARNRERELLRQLDARTAAEAAHREETGRMLSRAEEEIRLLGERRKRSELVNGQIQGFYAELQRDIRNRDFGGAVSDLEKFRTYLQDPAVGALPEVERRREADLFVIETLERLARKELERQSTDVSSITASFELLSRLRDTVGRAAAMAGEGRSAEARTLYTEALGMIPEIEQSHAFVLDRIRAAENERARLLAERIENARTASASGDFEGALAWYGKALDYLPEDPELGEHLLTGIREAGLELGLREIRAGESRAAAEVLSRAGSAERRGDFRRAAELYVEVIRDYPRSTQTLDASAGLRRALEADGAAALLRSESERTEGFRRALAAANAEFDAGDFASSLRGYADALAYLPADETVRQDLLSRIRNAGIQLAVAGERRAQSTQAAALLARADGLLSEGRRTDAVGEYLSLLQRYPESEQTRNAVRKIQSALAAGTESTRETERIVQLERDKAALAQEAATLRSEIGLLRGQLAARPEIDPATQETLDRLQRIAANYERLRDAYRGYADSEDAAVSRQGEQGLVDAKRHLDGFLASDEAGDAMPGILERIKRYDRAFETYGREAALQDVTDIMYRLASYGSRDERLRFLDRAVADYRDDSGAMADLIGELKELIRE